MYGLRFKCETQNTQKRLIYFSGHPQLQESTTNRLITRVYSDCGTINGLLYDSTRGWLPLECASRTLSNLYNLHACRGCITDSDGEKINKLVLSASMSGPHHYLGHIDPRDYISVYIPKSNAGEFDLPIYTSYFISDTNNTNNILAQQQSQNTDGNTQRPKNKTSIPAENIFTLSEYWWISGKDMTNTLKKRYGNIGTQFGSNIKLINTQTGLAQNDSLFPNPGVLELGVSEIRLQIINPDTATNGGVEYDFSGFGAQIVPNSQPWRFNQASIRANPHAQHKLRLITYYYGSRYVPDYLLRNARHPQGVGSGLFIERHEFIQAITPINPDCGGFVILGRELKTWHGHKVGLELIGVQVPFGYTLLVEPWAIHGDSNLVGLYSMAMTGNHIAMATADTVFIKNHNNAGNVRVIGVLDGARMTTITISGKIPTGQQKLLLISDHMDQDELQSADAALKAEIRSGCSWLESWYYNPVIWAPQLGKKNTIQYHSDS